MKQVDSLKTENKFKKTEIGKIPVDWEVVRLGEIGKIITGNTPSTKDKKYYNGKYMFVTPFDMGNFKYVVKTATTLTEEGINISRRLPCNTVMVTCIASIGKIGMAYEECCTNQQINSIICNKNTDPHFVYYMIHTKINALKALAGQTAVSIVKKSLFLKMSIPLPTFPEQKKIAEILSTADKAIEKINEIIEKSKELKKGLMQQLLTRGIGHKKFKKTRVGKIPAEWNIVKLSSIAEVTKLAGFEYSKYFEGYKNKGEIIVIRGSNIKGSKLDLSDIKTIPVKISESLERSKLHKNDLVFAYVGTIGPVALVEENNKYHLGPNTSKITPNEAMIYPKYLLQFFRSNLLRNEIQKYISVGAQPSLSMTKIRKFEIILPNNLSEQKKIAEILLSVDEEIEKEIKYKENIENIKMGLMQVLLTGKVRIKV